MCVVTSVTLHAALVFKRYVEHNYYLIAYMNSLISGVVCVIATDVIPYGPCS